MTQPSSMDFARVLSRREALASGLKAGASLGGLLWAAGWLTGCAAPTSAATGSGARAVSGSSTVWASGGTAAMKGGYPNPFAGSTGGTCTLTPELTVGPCYAPTLMRRDISEGLTGLPMRLALRVVRADTCAPVSGATVDVWHTNARGTYSAYPQGSMCNPDSAEAATAHFFRGVQTTDADGRVDFDTVFPGWYSSRTVHIHFTVRIGNDAYVTSQLFFDDALTDAILQAHPDYSGRPARDTNNKNDTVLGNQDAAGFLLSSARMADGALQVWKTIAIRA